MRRTATLVASGGLLAATLFAAPATAAPAAPEIPAQAATGDYSGGGLAELLQVDASLAGTDIVDVDLTPASVNVNTTTDPRSRADVANLDATLLGAVSLDDVLSTGSQTAPPDNQAPVDVTLLDVPIDPVLNLDVSSATAFARWPGDGECVAPGEPISQAFVQTAGADVLEVPGLGSLVTVVNDAGGATATQSTISTELVDGQAGRALQTESLSQITSVILFQGTPAETAIEIASTPTLTATATGTPGGATAEFSAPVVNIVTADAGIPDLPLINLVPLDQLGGLLDTVTDGLEDAINTTLGEAGVLELNVLLGEETVSTTAAPDGTSVTSSAAAVILELSVLPVVGDPVVAARIAVAPLSAAAQVPVGGIDCDPEEPRVDDPLRDLHKDVSQAQVAPGGTFDYTLTVPNRGPCTLTDVVVTDVVTGPASSISADPAATTTNGDTLTWNVGTIEPNETKTFTLSIGVAEGSVGQTFSDTLTASGTCDDEPVTKTVTLDLPTVSNGFAGPCDLSLSNKRASHLEVTPGQTFNYFIHAFNRGEEDCSSVSVTDTLDDRVSFVSCTDGCTNTGQDVSWTGQSVPGGSGITLTVTVRVDDDAQGELANTAVITSPDDDAPVTVTWNGPQITDQSVLAPPDPPQLVTITLARTGGDLPLAVLMGVAVSGLLGLALRRRLTV